MKQKKFLSKIFSSLQEPFFVIFEKGFFMKIYGFLPARIESNRFPRKLLAKLGKKTVIQRSYEAALQSTLLEKVFIVTDSKEIEEEAASFAAPTLLTSKKPLSGTERIVEAFHAYPFLQEANFFLNLQADHPFTAKETIDSMVSLFQKEPTVPLVTCVKPLSRIDYISSEHVVKCVFDKNHNALYFSRSFIPFSQKKTLPVNCFQHIGIYGYSKKFLLNYNSLAPSPLEEAEGLEQLRFLENGIPIKVALVEDIGQGVDVPEDMKRCEEILCQSSMFL